jgi:integrase
MRGFFIAQNCAYLINLTHIQSVILFTYFLCLMLQRDKQTYFSTYFLLYQKRTFKSRKGIKLDEMKKIQFTFVFGRKQKDGNGLIELRAYCNGKQKYFSTKIYVQPHEWSKSKQLIVRNPNKDNLNDELDSLMERLTRRQRKSLDNDEVFNLDSVKSFIKEEKIKIDSFSEFAYKEIESDNSLVKGTKHSKKNTVDKILSFNDDQTVLFEHINYSFCHEFINFLQGLKLEQSTIQKHHKNFKSLIELAIKKGCYLKRNPLKEIRVSVPFKQVVALTWEQVLEIEKLKFEPYEKKLRLFRDMFLFSCYTGLRVSDITTLKTEHIKFNDDGVYIEKQTVKTKKNAVLPLSKLFPLPNENTTRPLKILDQYYDENNELVFKKYTEQVYNRDLKEIAFKAKITDVNLTAHIGRKTFATYLGRNSMLSNWDLKHLLQHSNMKTTERYVFTDEKRINESLGKAEWD